MWKVQTGKCAPLWCTLLLFTRADGKCFMPPIIVRQSKKYSQDIHHNIPLDWAVHHTPYLYMDRDRWLKAMTQFSNRCGASPVNNQIIFFGGHYSHFNDCALAQAQRKNIQPFILKAGDSFNNQPSKNRPNSKLKALYKIPKAKWMLKHGTMMFQPHHTNSVLVETWEAFTVSAGNIVRDSFTKTHLLPLSPPNIITNTQACVASIQTYSKGINHIAEAHLHLLSFLQQVPTTLWWSSERRVLFNNHPETFFSGRKRMAQCKSELSSLFEIWRDNVWW